YQNVVADLGVTPEADSPPGGQGDGAAAVAEPSARPSADADLLHVAAAMALVKAYRTHGHLAARLDPLGSEPIGDPALDPEPLGLTPEGVDLLVPMLDLLLELAAERSARQVVLGMAHRGRLNVLTHVVGRPYVTIFAEFEGTKARRTHEVREGEDEETGDVKYHHGAEGAYRTRAGKVISVSLAHNPSHLEYVCPVVEGRSRAQQTNRRGRELHHDPSDVLPVLIHGDAAFAGQGVVQETLNLSALRGYDTGGTVHLITNNQIGFTTDMEDARSTRYASDLAKGFDIPIIHVNADDPEACLAAVRLAMRYKSRFHHDVLIDLVGYRRHGHNEADEPAYTQPLMSEAIKRHPPVREVYSQRLAAEGSLSEAQAAERYQRAYQQLVEIQQGFKASLAHAPAEPAPARVVAGQEPETAVAAETLGALNQQLLAW